MSKLTTIEFHDDTLFAVEDGGAVYVAVKPICDGLGLDWRAQRQRIQRTPILAKGGCMMHLPSPGGSQETLCLRLDLVNGWLFGIDAERVSPEARVRVLSYQDECFAVLHAHFYGRRADRALPPLEPTTARDAPIRVRRQLVSQALKIFGPRAAAQLWQRLDLPMVPAMAEPPEQGDFGFTYTAIPTAPAA